MHTIALPPQIPHGAPPPADAGRDHLPSDHAERARQYWLEKLEGLASEADGEAFHEFHLDYPRPASPSVNPTSPMVERLDAATVAALRDIAQAQNAGLHALLLALLAAEARRRDGRTNLIIGSAILPGAETPEGVVDNLWPLGLASQCADPLSAQMAVTQATLNEAAKYGGYPCRRLYAEFRQRHPHLRPASSPSLFDISLAEIQPGVSGDRGADSLLATSRMAGAASNALTDPDLDFRYEPMPDGAGGLKLSLVWNPDVYRRETAKAWLDSFVAWARWLGEDIARASAPLPALLPEEARRLAHWERGAFRARPAKRFHQLFEDVADAQPHRPAVVTEAVTQSFAELEQQANRVARLLLDHGVAREEPVAVLTECSSHLPATVLGIWKAGAAYLPLAMDQPAERLAYMARNASVRTLVALDGHVPPPSLAQAVQAIVRPEDWQAASPVRPQIAGAPEDLAYIIYTSGTTGMPKGVLIQHDSLVNSAAMTGEACGLTPEDRVSLVATPGFDASLWEMGMALLHGMAIVPVSRALRDDPWTLKRWYKRHGVTVAFHTPSYLRASQEAPFEGLRVLITGGEAPNHDDARRYAGKLALWNAYGPTEACIFVSAEQLTAQPAPDRPLAVGKPLANTRISIRRENGDPAPPGVTGEVWLGGIGVARGYLNNLVLTEQRFVDTRDGRFYRSGDLGRWTGDGRLELAGRLDDQVKIHGQRVELGEIEQALCSHPVVEEAVTLLDAGAEGTKVLRAFVRLGSGTALPSEDGLRDYLVGRLPAHMVPASVTSVNRIPLTVTGKIDRDALLAAARAKRPVTHGTAPQGALETQIASVWEKVLQAKGGSDSPGTRLGDGISREDNFFALGGNSLLAVIMTHRLSQELDRSIPARELFAAPTLAGFAQRIEVLNTVPPPAPVRSDLATEGQREFRVAEAAGLDTRTFTMLLVRVVQGEMPSLDRCNKAWAQLVARHEALRTRFYEDAEGRLRRASAPGEPPRLAIVTQPDHAAARAFIRQRQSKSFDMGVPPVWHAGLVRVEDTGEHLFWLALHHSVGDGQSLGVIAEEMGALLRGEPLSPLAGNFGESAHREEDYLVSPSCAADGRYWLDLLLRQPEQAFAEGPLDFPRSLAAKAGNHRFEGRLDAQIAHGLRSVARRHEASLHAVMLTLLALEARRRQGRENVIIGATASTRENAADARVVGYYVNMLPLPCRLPRDDTFGAALSETQKSLAEGLQHARYPFARMYRDFWSERPQHRDPARYPLFDLAVTENPELPPSPGSLRLAPCPAPPYELTDASPGQDMVLTHETLADGSLLLDWHVNAALYTRETAECWFAGLRGWAEWLAKESTRAKVALPGLLPDEVALLEQWEYGSRVSRPALGFHELFEQVVDTPGQSERAAVISPSGTLSYGALEREANALAHSFLRRGAASGCVIGVLTGRSGSLPATVLGIWKAGATYLPLAVDLPPDRLAFMAHDAGMAHWIVLDGLAVPPKLAKVLPSPWRPEDLDPEFRRASSHRPPPSGGARAPAYIIYTSGSTGQPKGTLIGHEAYINSVLGVGEAYRLTPADRYLMFASPSFDVSLSDIGVPLAFGVALCPVFDEVLCSPARFRDFLTETGVTVADLPPTYLRLLEGAALPSLRILVTGGEAPFPADVESYAGRLAYFNAYGPTENAITSTLGKLNSGGRHFLSAGRPLPNTSVQVCNPAGRPVPPGVAGELWLGGAGLAQGYVGRSDLTGAAFVDTPRGRCYRSGDLGRWHASGEIEILGRIDDQVKLNGIRIELGEIEHALASHPHVAQAVALLDGGPNGTPSLWGFVCPQAGKSVPDDEGWREYLVDRLPSYMMPSAVIGLPAIPLTHSGKVDKAALKAHLAVRSTPGIGSEPQGSLEVEIARLWGDLLGRESIGRDDNFFSLGGHSLLAIKVANCLEQTLGHPVAARELFAEPTLRGFAARISQLNEPSPAETVSSDRATEGQREFWVAERSGGGNRSFNIHLLLKAGGRVLSLAQWRLAWEALVARHEALRTGFREDGNGVLRRFVLPHVDTAWGVVNLSNIPGLQAYIQERQADPLTMTNPPLWRAGLAQLAGEDQPVFWLVVHHAVADGVSLGVLAEELSSLLARETLPPVAGRFDQSAAQQERYLSSPACQEDARYWRTTLGGLGSSPGEAPQPFDEWPVDFPRALGRAADQAGGAHCFRVHLDAGVAAGLRRLARKNGASLHALVLTIVAQEVRRRTGRPEFLLGTAASTRDSADEARIVGYYVNMLPLPCRVKRQESIEQALSMMQRNLAEGLRHARYPFARMVADFRQASNGAPHPARHPLFDLVVTENAGAGATHFSDIATARGYELRRSAPPQDMVLVHESPTGGSLILQWYASAALYEKETAEDWIDSLAGWMRFLAGGERLANRALPDLLPDEERLLSTWEHGPTLPPPAPSFPAWFEQLARRRPDRPALVTDQGALTYAELDGRSNALAHALISRGVARHDVVGVLTERSPALPETVLAIWKAGACYLPLIADLPAERLAFMAREAGIRNLMILDGFALPPPLGRIGCQVFRPEILPRAYFTSHVHPVDPGGDGVRGAELAYIIYTSGSTGEPKGVMLRHQGLTNLALGIVGALEMQPGDRASLMASPAFDAWIAELLMAWGAGGAVVPILRGEMDNPLELREKFVRLGVTVASMTPSYLRLFAQADFPSLRILLTAGEPPIRADALHYAARLRFMNGYGPTESTVAVGYGLVTPRDQRFAVGKPLPNTSVHIRGRQGERVPPGAVGSVWLGGVQLAAGYLNRPDITAASFVETPCGRLYCTGDLGRWTPAGELQILGRSDGQVKLRGQRIELEEVEHRLGAHPGVRQAVAAVDTTSGGGQTLWAFVCLHPGAPEPTQAAWQDYLCATLPSYMLPLAVLRVPSIPATIAGKVDRTALVRAATEAGLLEAVRERNPRTQPLGGLEESVARVWAEHLECRGIGREDNFFDLGGNSLRAITVVNQLRRTLHCTVNDLYEHPRLADFARVCRRRPEHLRALIRSARRHWESYRHGLAGYEAERSAALAPAYRSYDARNQSYGEIATGKRRDYAHVLLTGSTGYLGSYVLRELLADRAREVSALVRGTDDRTARARLGEVLCYYFGHSQGAALRDNPRLKVLAGDLRRDDLGLEARTHERLADGIRAVFHCAANVRHFGHYWELHADNVAATGRLLKLAARRAAHPADFHLVSTLSVCGKAPEEGFRLFTEYDPPPETPDENYYTRSKQEAERLVVSARHGLANACVHRVGNLVFPAGGGPLQFNIRENAFFRQIAAFLRLGVVPGDSHVWLCHVDLVARAVVLLAEDACLANETHHVENARRDTVAGFVTAAGSVRAGDFGAFLDRLEEAIDQPGMDLALTETLENFGLYHGVAPQGRARRQEIVSGRTRILLAKLGLVWPPVPAAGQMEMLHQAGRLFSPATVVKSTAA